MAGLSNGVGGFFWLTEPELAYAWPILAVTCFGYFDDWLGFCEIPGEVTDFPFLLVLPELIDCDGNFSWTCRDPFMLGLSCAFSPWMASLLMTAGDFEFVLLTETESDE